MERPNWNIAYAENVTQHQRTKSSLKLELMASRSTASTAPVSSSSLMISSWNVIDEMMLVVVRAIK
jgi:hypothetical protein